MTKEDLNRRKSRAKLWKEFRADFLLTQTDLAGLLGVSRRTVQYVEKSEVAPHKTVQSRFDTLYKQRYTERNNSKKRAKETV